MRPRRAVDITLTPMPTSAFLRMLYDGNISEGKRLPHLFVLTQKNHSSRTKAGGEGMKRRDKKPPDRGNKRGLGSLGKQNVIKEIRQGWQRKGAGYGERKQRYCGCGCVRRCVRGRGGDGDFEKWSKRVSVNHFTWSKFRDTGCPGISKQLFKIHHPS
ncbi:hypothetical protein AOLI_G00000480 [Acnodon oligacanthus]